MGTSNLQPGPGKQRVTWGPLPVIGTWEGGGLMGLSPSPVGCDTVSGYLVSELR